MPESSVARLQTVPHVTDVPPADCYHCGLPVPNDINIPAFDVLGEERSFCCHGCLSVCQAILNAGLEAYYQHRTEKAVTANQQKLPALLDQLELYDRPEVQQGFIRQHHHSCEAALLIEDIRCPACLWLNERKLRTTPGVVDVHIDDTTHRARVRWDPEQTRLSTILRAINDIGYKAYPYDADRSLALQQQRKHRSTERLIFAGAAGMLVMNFSLATYLMAETGTERSLPYWISIGRWTSLFVCLTILAYPGLDFFLGAWRDLKNRRLGMDIPICLGLTAALLGSLHATVTQRGEVYFDSIAMFVFFLLLARRWETQGKLRAAGHLDRMARATPRSARRQDQNGHYTEVLASDLEPGDRIRVLPGETLCVDGRIINGNSSFDESLLTGEAMPVSRATGDRVIAGSINADQPVIVEVSHRITASTLHEIQQLVEQGIRSQPRYALITELVARWFVAAVLVIASATAFTWIMVSPDVWLHNTIAVLIVTCPCALALATPVALAVIAGRLLQHGILPVNMKALDTLIHCDLAVFDKTGTLTQGKPAITDVVTLHRYTRNEVLSIATALSHECTHPLSRAFSTFDVTPVQVTNAFNQPGLGISACIDGADWFFGKYDSRLNNALAYRAEIDALTQQHKIVSVLADASGIQAVFGFSDALRPGICEMLNGLKQAGIQRFAILSGDTQSNVSALASQLGISETHGGFTPADKLSWIRTQHDQGHRMIMMGDGINDTPVLAAADASFSYSDATDLANLNSDFVLLGNDPDGLVRTLKAARATRNNIIQNMSWAIGYNLFVIPMAVAGQIPPWGAALGMSFSSLLVVLNALRLQKQ